MLKLSNKIVCLSGSTRFKSDFESLTRVLTLNSNIVLAPQIFSNFDGEKLNDEQIKVLHILHERKILMSDIMLVLAPGVYIGDSTSKEIAFARANNIPVEIISNFDNFQKHCMVECIL